MHRDDLAPSGGLGGADLAFLLEIFHVDADRERSAWIVSPDRAGHALKPLLAGGMVRWNRAVRVLVAEIPRPHPGVAGQGGRGGGRQAFLGSNDRGVGVPIADA